MGIWYTTREAVMSASDSAVAGRLYADVDRAIEAGARRVDALTHRTFYPWTGTRYFDTPDWDGHASVGRIWLAPHDLAELTSITTGNGTTVVPTASVITQPQEGPPFEWLDINRGTAAAWESGTTNQRATAVVGVYAGAPVVEVPAGTTAEALDASETGVDIGPAPGVGVGSLIRVDSERMVVTGKSWTSTGQTGSLAANKAGQALAVADGTAFAAGDLLVLDAERVRVVDVVGNVLSVVRAVDGTTLAVHTTATIYAQRTLTVERGAAGTTAATHSTAAPVLVWTPPGLVEELNAAYAIDTLSQRSAGYARVAGSGDNQREATGRSIRSIEHDVRAAHGRLARKGAV